MAATSLAAVRAGLAAAIKAQFGPDVQCSGYLLVSATPPCFDVLLQSVTYDEAMNRGLDELTLTVRGVVQNTSDIGGQKNLDEWCVSSGPTSVKAALEADRTLGGVCQTLKVTELGAYQKFTSTTGSGADYLAADWTVVVYGSGI